MVHKNVQIPRRYHIVVGEFAAISDGSVNRFFDLL